MSETTLSLGLNMPRLHPGELAFLQEWSASRATKFPHFGKWLCEIANTELGRRLTPGSEAGTIDLPDLRGVEAADFLQGSYSMAQQPMTEGLAAFIDDAHRKIVCDVAGFLEWQAEQ